MSRPSVSALSAPRKFTVGYALDPMKVASVIQPSLINHAKERGIDLIPIDTTKPLTSQGPFDCVIHKLYSDEWKQKLVEFKSRNPKVVIVDSLDYIQPLRNRISMLEVVNKLETGLSSSSNVTFGVPKQVLVRDAESLLIADLKFPVIAKPLLVDGSAKSHEMLLVFTADGLKKVKPSILLQEFVNHGGVIFKVYVAGDYVKCVKRASLPDVSEEKLGTLDGVISFSDISNLTRQQHKTTGEGEEDDDHKCLNMARIEETALPPSDFVRNIAFSLQKAMKLHLFNFDMIRDASNENRYLVIDINYFPGYAKVPGYETILTDFFLDVVYGRDDLCSFGTEQGPVGSLEGKNLSAFGADSLDRKGVATNRCDGGDDKEQPS